MPKQAVSGIRRNAKRTTTHVVAGANSDVACTAAFLDTHETSMMAAQMIRLARLAPAAVVGGAHEADVVAVLRVGPAESCLPLKVRPE